MNEYSPLPGTARSYVERVEFDEPCTRNKIGSGCSPAFGAPTRLRQRLSRTPPLFAQYSELQTSPLAARLASCARAGIKPDTRPAPIPMPAVLRIVRRAIPRLVSLIALSLSSRRRSCCGRLIE